METSMKSANASKKGQSDIDKLKGKISQLEIQNQKLKDDLEN